MTKTKLVAVLGLTLTLLAVVMLLRADRYGEVSERGYQYATALFSCCNQRDAGKLEQISEMIETDLREKKLTTAEKVWLEAIVRRGRRGQWGAAASEVRQLMLDQVEPI